MKKRQFSGKLKLTKVAIYDLSAVNGGKAQGTHYEWCENGYTEFPCNLTIEEERI